MSPLVFAPARLPLIAHLALGLWVAFFLGMAELRPLDYGALLQEDRFVEWFTVALFAAAGWFALRRALRRRRAWDGLVAAFCVFVAGEEFSWGQRLLGLTPPDAFLEHNRQQELTLHNFASIFGEPRWILVVALLGFGVLLPLVARSARGERVLERIGASRPPRELIPWFVVAVVLLVWYPHSFTGEWVEALAGATFMLAYIPSARAAATASIVAAVVALALAILSGVRSVGSAAEHACVRAEIDALIDDIGHGPAATGRLIGADAVHKRVFTAIEEGYVRRSGLAAYDAARCPGDADAVDRRRHAIDPWGTAYWLRLDRIDDRIEFEVYSFGPNRRRDSGGGDDVILHESIAPLAPRQPADTAAADSAGEM